MPEGIIIEATDEQLAGLKYNSDGLITAIAQDVENGDILMLAWMNEESLKMTFAEGRMVYWSRSRQELWRKGDTSGNTQTVLRAAIDCDGDTLLLTVHQTGPACHTGTRTCFDDGQLAVATVAP